MANKQLISAELTLSTVNKEGYGDSQGKLSLEVFYVGIKHTLIKQMPDMRCTLMPFGELPAANLAKAWYEEGMRGVERHSQKIRFSGTSAELDFEPTSAPDIKIILQLDERGRREGPGVGNNASNKQPLTFSYDNTTKQIIASRPNRSYILATYQASWCMIRYTPHGQINLTGGNTTTYGSLLVYHDILLPTQDEVSDCQSQPIRTYEAEIDLAPPPMDGDNVEICAVTSEFIVWEDESYEIPPNYPGSSKEDRKVEAGSQGSSVILPEKDDHETWQFPRKHVIWKMNTYSGVVTRTDNNPTLVHPHATKLWENASGYTPKFSFSSTKPSEKHAGELFDKVDWDGIKDHVRKTYPGCSGV